MTSMYEQAVSYANRFTRRGDEAWLNVYELEFDPNEWKVLQFSSYDMKWLDFISKCRAGSDDYDFDIVIGGVANDKVIRTLDRYFMGEISAEAAIGMLQYEKPNNQYCIRSQQAVDKCLTYLESKKL